MKITYIKLVNIAGFYVGGNRDTIEINFDKSKNKIIAIEGINASGKTTLLSSLHPFANVTSLDERSTLPYILDGKDGYKEIHYQDGNDEYIIKHYFKSTKSSHTVKSYFIKNGEELNENGNVTSFNMLVEVHMGLTQDMMRLLRIGSNVNSFVSLTPARRKEYIGKLIEDIDLYMKIYKKINEDLKVVKVLIQTNASNLYNYHISDIVVEEDQLSKLWKDMRSREKERDTIISKLSKIEMLIKGNDINELKRKREEASSRIKELDQIEERIISESLENITMEDLISKIRNDSSISTIYGLRFDSSFKNMYKDKEQLKKMVRKLFHEEIREIENFRDKEIVKENVNLKCGICDLVVETKENIILIEMQNKNLKDFKKRLKRYVSMLYATQELSEDYCKMKPVKIYLMLNYREGKKQVLKKYSEMEKELKEEFDCLSEISVWNLKEALKQKRGVDYDYARLCILDKMSKEEALDILEELYQKEEYKKEVEEKGIILEDPKPDDGTIILDWDDYGVTWE